MEAGQNIADTRTREFAEEALNSTQRDGEASEEYLKRIAVLEMRLKQIFSKPLVEDDILFSGVVDDARNTDFAWIETVAILTILTGDLANLKLEAGDDAGKAKWKDYSPSMDLFASHGDFIARAVAKLAQRGIVDRNGNVL